MTRPSRASRSLRAHTLPLLLAAASAFTNPAARAQEGDKDLEDPFTKGDPAAMQALGIVAYGPFVWADDMRTTDVDKVLGEDRIRWLETEHFCIGSTLEKGASPQDSKARKILNDELGALNQRHGKLPKRSSKLSPWLRTHLFAHRAESLYAEFAELTGHKDHDTYLGQRGKLLLLLFQKRSDLARYADRFCGRQTTVTLRHLHTKTNQRLLAIAVEGDDGDKDEAALMAQFRFMLTLLFHDAVGGAPFWLSHGLAHHYERQVPCNLINCAPKEGEHLDEQTQNEWHKKLKARVRHEELCTPFRRLCTSYDLGYYGSLEAWSRVEFLLEQDRARFAQFLQGVVRQTSQARQVQALLDAFELEPEQFDEQWRAWVTKTY